MSRSVISQRVALLACLLFVIGAVRVEAQGTLAPFRSYYVDNTGYRVPIPDPYVLDHIIEGTSLGIGDFASPSDILINRDNGHLYIVDSGNDRIIELDAEERVVRQFGVEQALNEPRGIFRDRGDGTLWIADTGNARILQMTADGELLSEFGPPESDVLAEIDSAAPSKVLVDKRGYIYYLEQSGAGMIVMDRQNRFRGFFGANRLGFSLRWLWARYMATEEQKEKLLLAKPTSHSDMYLGDDGFIYTAVAGETTRQIQKLSPVGVNIFIEKSLEKKLYLNRIFGEERRYWEPPARFTTLAVDAVGTVTAIDSNSGRIYQYDQDRNLLMAFGRLGTSRIQFGVPTEVEVDSRGRLYVLDSGRAVVHVLQPTLFAELVHRASSLQFDGRYEEAAESWQRVLEEASHYELAHSGIGAAHYHDERWEEAMEAYSLARDQLGYSLAFYEYRQGLLRRNMGWLVTGVFGSMALVIVWPALARLRPRRGTRPAQLRYGERQLHPLLGILVKPVQTFETVKMGQALWPALALISAAALARLLSLMLIAFHMRATPSAGSVANWVRLYRPVAAYLLPELRWEDANLVVEVLRIVVPWLLWTAANYGVSTLFDGEGAFRGVVRTTAFCLVPYIVFAVPIALMSHAMTAQERGLYETLWGIVFYWVLLLLMLQVFSVHNFPALRTLGVGAGMTFGTAILAAAILLAGLLGGEVVTFLGELLYEGILIFYL